MRRILVGFCISSAIFTVVSALNCYQCNNAWDENCDQDMNDNKVHAQPCPDTAEFKCGTQIQETMDDGWFGLMRACYRLGSLPGMNETNGCHVWTNPWEGFSAHFCFCDTDGCNTHARSSESLNHDKTDTWM